MCDTDFGTGSVDEGVDGTDFRQRLRIGMSKPKMRCRLFLGEVFGMITNQVKR